MEIVVKLWCIIFLVLGLSAIRVVCVLLLIAVMILLRFVRVLSLDLSVIFVTVALVTCVAAAVLQGRISNCHNFRRFADDNQCILKL